MLLKQWKEMPKSYTFTFKPQKVKDESGGYSLVAKCGAFVTILNGKIIEWLRCSNTKCRFCGYFGKSAHEMRRALEHLRTGELSV
jgi:hypothetical protein